MVFFVEIAQDRKYKCADHVYKQVLHMQVLFFIEGETDHFRNARILLGR